MPKYKLQAPDGRTVTVEGDEPPDEAALDEIFASLPAAAVKEKPAAEPTKPGAAVPPVVGMLGKASEAFGGLLTGAAKEAPLVATRAAAAPERAISATLAGALEAIGAKDFAQRMRQQTAERKAAVEEPFVPQGVETGPEKLGRTLTRTAPQAALAALTGGASLPAQAAIQGAAGAAQTASEGAGPGEVAASGVLSAAAPVVAAGAGKALSAVSDKLKSSAIKLYNQALHPTKEATKVTAERVLPEALERGIQGNLRQIGDLAEEQVATLGSKIHETYRAATAAGKRISATQLANAIEPLKVSFTSVTTNPKMVESTLVNAAGQKITTPQLIEEVTVLNPGAISAIEDIQSTLRSLGKNATPEDIQKYKRVIDDLVSSSNGFTRDLPRGSAKEIGRRARKSFAQVLEQAAPSVEQLNTEFAFWKGLQRIVKETSTRKVGQQETVELLESGIRKGGIGGAVGGVIGAAIGGPTGAAVGGGLGFAAASKLAAFMKTPLYRTWSATHKNALAGILAGNAKALASVEGKQVQTMLALAGIKAVVGREDQDETSPSDRLPALQATPQEALAP